MFTLLCTAASAQTCLLNQVKSEGLQLLIEATKKKCELKKIQQRVNLRNSNEKKRT